MRRSRTPTPADDARSWAVVYLHGARAALDAAEKNPPGSLQYRMNIATAQQQIGLAVMKRIQAKGAGR